MGFAIEWDCPLFTLSFNTDTDPTPDVLDGTLTRLNRAIAEGLAQTTPHATVMLGEDEDDD